MLLWSVVFAVFSYAVALDTESIRFLGRWDLSGSPTADWSGTGIALYIEPIESNSMVSIQYGDCGSDCYFGVDVFVNGELYNVYNVVASSRIDLNLTLALGVHHELAVIKRTEANNGDARGLMIVEDIFLTNVTLLSPVTASTNILFVGDSLTAAYGVDGTYPCDFSADTENVLHSYATLVGRELDAEVSIVAWSGKGVVRNYGDASTTSTNPLPMYYNRTLAIDSASYWYPVTNQMDIVVVMLGTNDYSTDPMPADEQFIYGYISFLTTIRSDYPTARIISVCAPFQRGNQCSNIAAAAQASQVEYLYMPSDLVTCPELCGCDGHPNAEGQENMAKALLEVLKM